MGVTPFRRLRPDAEADTGVTLVDWAAAFQRALSTEVLRSEQRRITILIGCLAFAYVLYLLLILVPGVMEASLLQKYRLLAPQATVLLAIAIGYELSVRKGIGWLLKHGRQAPRLLRYVNTFIEMSFPTLLILIAATVFDPFRALVSVPALFYFVFISLATLQLDRGLCVFAGVVAALEYMMLAFSYLLTSPEVEQIRAPHLYVNRALFLIVAGAVAGFVATQIRRQFTVSVRTMEERNRAISIFGQHVSPQVADKLLRQPIELGGELRTVCVMFVDIRDFSHTAAQKTPHEVMDYLNAFFGCVIDVVNQHRGIVNKFLGDGVMAVFGAPVDDAEQCTHAVDAGREIVRQVERMNAEGRIPPTRVGIGLHLGEVVTGNVGSVTRKEYTIIGDAVNLAARIEQATKEFSSAFLISEAVWLEIDRAAYRGEDLGPVQFKGQARPVRLYKIA